MRTNFLNDNGAVTLFENDENIRPDTIKKSVKKFTKSLKKTAYKLTDSDSSKSTLSISPIFGFPPKLTKIT